MTEQELWVGAALILATAGIVKGATGIGYATFALPFLAILVGLKTAMVLIIAPTLAINASLALTGGQLRETLRSFSPLYLAMLPGVGAGVLLLSEIEQRSAVSVLGICIVAYSALALAMPNLSLSKTSARWLLVPVGLLNGVLTGLTGSQVIPLVPYMMALQLPANHTIQAINIGVLILSAMLGVSLLATQTIAPWLMLASAAGIVPALAGGWLGRLIQTRLPTALLRTLILTVVGLSGLKMVLAP